MAWIILTLLLTPGAAAMSWEQMKFAESQNGLSAR